MSVFSVEGRGQRNKWISGRLSPSLDWPIFGDCRCRCDASQDIDHHDRLRFARCSADERKNDCDAKWPQHDGDISIRKSYQQQTGHSGSSEDV
mmetsp:Transcript_38578/g.86946  ORF Transcript_38578/g.86946 Transcript_38578/m.86946 type:complete len:93 (+) Transcript_38578:107-385(+)